MAASPSHQNPPNNTAFFDAAFQGDSTSLYVRFSSPALARSMAEPPTPPALTAAIEGL